MEYIYDFINTKNVDKLLIMYYYCLNNLNNHITISRIYRNNPKLGINELINLMHTMYMVFTYITSSKTKVCIFKHIINKTP